MSEQRPPYTTNDPGDETTPRLGYTADEVEEVGLGEWQLKPDIRLGCETYAEARHRIEHPESVQPSWKEMAAAIQRLAGEHHKRERLLGKESVPHRDLVRANQCVEAAYDSLVALAARLPGGRG